jgi:hypothetical protein
MDPVPKNPEKWAVPVGSLTAFDPKKPTTLALCSNSRDQLLAWQEKATETETYRTTISSRNRPHHHLSRSKHRRGGKTEEQLITPDLNTGKGGKQKNSSITPDLNGADGRK